MNLNFFHKDNKQYTMDLENLYFPEDTLEDIEEIDLEEEDSDIVDALGIVKHLKMVLQSLGLA